VSMLGRVIEEDRLQGHRPYCRPRLKADFDIEPDARTELFEDLAEKCGFGRSRLTRRTQPRCTMLVSG